MSTSERRARPAEDLTSDQLAWLLHSEALWREAHAIVSEQPTLDPGDVYHALRALELSPTERLRRGLTRFAGARVLHTR
jgi:hypothetical protein